MGYPPTATSSSSARPETSLRALRTRPGTFLLCVTPRPLRFFVCRKSHGSNTDETRIKEQEQTEETETRMGRLVKSEQPHEPPSRPTSPRIKLRHERRTGETRHGVLGEHGAGRGAAALRAELRAGVLDQQPHELRRECSSSYLSAGHVEAQRPAPTNLAGSLRLCSNRRSPRLGMGSLCQSRWDRDQLGMEGMGANRRHPVMRHLRRRLRRSVEIKVQHCPSLGHSVNGRPAPERGHRQQQKNDKKM